MRRQSKIVKMHKRVNINNIGFYVFLVVFIYLVASVIIYISRDTTVIYQVNTGSLSLDNIYTGFILRDETVITADYSGNVDYYIPNTGKANANSLVYSIDETGRVSNHLAQISEESLSDSTIDSVSNILSQYVMQNSSSNFSSIYNTKNSVISELTDSQYSIIMDDLDTIIENTGSKELFHKGNALKPGIILYSTDGYENYTEDRIDKNIFDSSSYELNNLQKVDIINVGEPVYRLIKSDNWSIYVELNETEASYFSEKSSVQIRFVDSDITCRADMTVINKNGTYFGKISLSKYMINFAEQRFIKIEITQNSHVGLKIPVTSVVKKNFYTIPKEYITASNNFVRISYSSTGEMLTEPVNATIYDLDETYYYVSMNDFDSGDVIMAADTGKQYIIGTMGELTGVYCVNRGYASFRMVEIIDENNEYYIVKSGTTYGLSVYDHIVLDYRTVDENKLIN